MNLDLVKETTTTKQHRSFDLNRTEPVERKRKPSLPKFHKNMEVRSLVRLSWILYLSCLLCCTDVHAEQQCTKSQTCTIGQVQGKGLNADVCKRVFKQTENLAMADVKKLVFSIIRFLQDQRTQLEEECAESLEVAIQCLESVYGIDTADEQTVAKYQVQKNLLDLFNAQLNIETDQDFSTLSLHEATPEEKEQAETLKNKGNDFMKAEKFSDAIECYTQAIKLDNKNAVYYCNRAAALSKINKHKQAIEDCQKALMIDPLYSKAYGRMGIAYTALEDHESALECYRKALELDPGNQSYQNNLEIAEQKLQEMAAQSGFDMGLGSMGGFGGMPNLAAMMNNPAMMQMAQSMMSNPEMQNMMSNMMQSLSQGGGDFGSIMQMGQQLAQQMQQQNPELVNQLRSQMGRPPTGPGDNTQPDQQQQPPGSDNDGGSQI